MSGKEAFIDILAFVIACQVGYSIYSTNIKVECQLVFITFDSSDSPLHFYVPSSNFCTLHILGVLVQRIWQLWQPFLLQGRLKLENIQNKT